MLSAVRRPVVVARECHPINRMKKQLLQLGLVQLRLPQQLQQLLQQMQKVKTVVAVIRNW